MRSVSSFAPSFVLSLVLAAGCGDGMVVGDDGGTRHDGGGADAASADAGSIASDAGPADAGDPDVLLRPRREACEFAAGAHVAETIGIDEATRSAIPIEHVIVFMQENRSFDHYFGRMPQYGHSDVEGIPADFTNPKPAGGTASPVHAGTTCLGPDIPHNWNAMHAQYHGGALDGFFENATSGGHDGQRALTWYDERDLPFYYWVYSHFSMADRMFSSVLGPTWPNRDYLYAAQSDGVRNTGERVIDVRTIFDALTDADVSWKEYADSPRTHCVGFTATTTGVVPTDDIFTDLASGDLPSVAFLDVRGDLDEHPVTNIQDGEHFLRRLVLAMVDSPTWSSTALIYTYDEAGGFFDHVQPPRACKPDDRTTNSAFNRMGFRVPLLVVSPWARPGYVSHRVHETTSITRFIELLFDLPALTNRDANSDALLDMFDFSEPALMTLPDDPPASGTGGCP